MPVCEHRQTCICSLYPRPAPCIRRSDGTSTSRECQRVCPEPSFLGNCLIPLGGSSIRLALYGGRFHLIWNFFYSEHILRKVWKKLDFHHNNILQHYFSKLVHGYPTTWRIKRVKLKRVSTDLGWNCCVLYNGNTFNASRQLSESAIKNNLLLPRRLLYMSRIYTVLYINISTYIIATMLIINQHTYSQQSASYS